MEWMIGKDWKFCKLKSEKEKERYESVDANATSKTDSVGKKMSRILCLPERLEIDMGFEG